MFQLVASAAHIALWNGQFQRVVRAHGIAGFARRLFVDADLAGEDGAFGLFPACTQAASDQGLIQAGDHRVGSPLWVRGARRPARPGCRWYAIMTGSGPALNKLALGITQDVQEQVIVGYDALHNWPKNTGAEKRHFIAIDHRVHAMLEGLEGV